MIDPSSVTARAQPSSSPAIARASRGWHRVWEALRRWRLPVLLATDLSIVALCWQLTYLFRLGFDRWWSARPAYDHWLLLALLSVYALAFLALKVPRAMWRFVGFPDVRALAAACLIAGLTTGVAVWLAQLSKVPRSVLALHPVVALMGLCVARMVYRTVYEQWRSHAGEAGSTIRRALLMGAGEAAKRLMASIHGQGWEVVALFDDDPNKLGARVGGVPVVGDLRAVAQAPWPAQATHVVVALPGATAAERRCAIDLASKTGLPVLTVPSASELREGGGRVERVRAIEPEDLLGREPVSLDEAGVSAMVSGRCVLITGAGGSIGSELVRQIAGLSPSRLVLFDLSELGLYQIEQQLSQTHPELPVTCLLGDVKVAEQIHRVCQQHRPGIVFHAAAHKHVPLMEGDNAWAAVRNNTLGTWHAAHAAVAAQAERFVLISTDKAVNPTNVMGASKRAAEMLLASMARSGGKADTRLVAVRFGNVLGSSGSVIPKFKEQIALGGPVTVTHPEITRYFMTIPEASRLVLQAAWMAQSGQVWVLDMGDAVRIVDLARELIRLSGHREGEIGIEFSGLRPGEKLYEELLADSDTTLPSAHPRLRIAQLAPPPDEAWVSELLSWCESLGPHVSGAACRAGLAARIPEYRPSAARSDQAGPDLSP